MCCMIMLTVQKGTMTLALTHCSLSFSSTCYPIIKSLANMVTKRQSCRNDQSIYNNTLKKSSRPGLLQVLSRASQLIYNYAFSSSSSYYG